MFAFRAALHASMLSIDRWPAASHVCFCLVGFATAKHRSERGGPVGGGGVGDGGRDGIGDGGGVGGLGGGAKGRGGGAEGGGAMGEGDGQAGSSQCRKDLPSL